MGYLPQTGAGSVSDICLPAGVHRVRFFSSQPAELKVDLRDGKTATLKLGGIMETVNVPPKVNAIVVTRTDAGTHPVSFAFG